MNLQQAVSWIHSLYRFGSNPGLERIEAVLERLGNPHRDLRCVHIAGTNGKGSTAAMLASILEAEGFSVGLYTSPYLEAFTNRMAINGRDIGETELVKLVAEVRPVVEQVKQTELGPPTEFEVVTALAFTYYQRAKPDWVVVEVGLGGRLDATNVITPAVGVITNIGLEHTQVLGDTIEKIAFEKAGIIKGGVPVVTAAEKPEAVAVIAEIAAAKGSPLWSVDKDVTYTSGPATLDGQVLDYRSPYHTLNGLKTMLPGRHQARNAATAVAARELMAGLPFNAAAVREGLEKTRWPGRLEIFSRRPLVLVDGAHNTDGILALRLALEEMLSGRKLRLILGILRDKAIDDILALIAPLATAELIITSPQIARAADPREVAALAARHAAVPVTVISDVPGAVKKTLGRLSPDEALCVSGSLYTITEAREALKQLLNTP